MANWRSRSKIVAGVAVALLVVTGLAAAQWTIVGAITPPLSAVSGPPSTAQPAPVPVSVVVATEGDIQQVIAGIGVVAPLASVTVRSQADGEVTGLPFTEGDVVQKGDLLAQINPVQMQAALAGAEAKRAQDQSQLDNARNDGERYSALARKGVVSAETLDQKSSAVQQFEALVKSDEAAIVSARAKLDDTAIRAPITGTTGFRLVDIGAVVSASAATAIVTVTQLDPIAVVFVAPGDRFDEIRQAMKNNVAAVEALSTDTNKVLARGKLTLMDNNVDAANGSIKLRATFDNHDGALWPGLPVATRLTTAIRHGVIVPDEVLSRGVDGLYAYIVDANGQSNRRVVDSSLVTDGMALVTKGIGVGDRVVALGRHQVGEGTAVTVSTDSTGATPAPNGNAVANASPATR